jgi:hypothetical protein
MFGFFTLKGSRWIAIGVPKALLAPQSSFDISKVFLHVFNKSNYSLLVSCSAKSIEFNVTGSNFVVAISGAWLPRWSQVLWHKQLMITMLPLQGRRVRSQSTTCNRDRSVCIVDLKLPPQRLPLKSLSTPLLHSHPASSLGFHSLLLVPPQSLLLSSSIIEAPPTHMRCHGPVSIII